MFLMRNYLIRQSLSQWTINDAAVMGVLGIRERVAVTGPVRAQRLHLCLRAEMVLLDRDPQ